MSNSSQNKLTLHYLSHNIYYTARAMYMYCTIKWHFTYIQCTLYTVHITQCKAHSELIINQTISRGYPWADTICLWEAQAIEMFSVLLSPPAAQVVLERPLGLFQQFLARMKYKRMQLQACWIPTRHKQVVGYYGHCVRRLYNTISLGLYAIQCL